MRSRRRAGRRPSWSFSALRSWDRTSCCCVCFRRIRSAIWLDFVREGTAYGGCYGWRAELEQRADAGGAVIPDAATAANAAPGIIALESSGAGTAADRADLLCAPAVGD